MAAMVHWPVRLLIPAWVADELLRFLVERCSPTDTGGGRNRLVSRSTLIGWLAIPHLLAADLARYIAVDPERAASLLMAVMQPLYPGLPADSEAGADRVDEPRQYRLKFSVFSSESLGSLVAAS